MWPGFQIQFLTSTGSLAGVLPALRATEIDVRFRQMSLCAVLLGEFLFP